MDQLPQPLCNQRQNSSTYSATADVTESAIEENATENYGNLSGRVVSPVTVGPFGENNEGYTPDPVTGQKDQQEIGISSRAIVPDVACEAAECKSGLKKLKAIKGANTAILSDRQVELIQGFLDGKEGRLTAEEFIDVIDFLHNQLEKKLPKKYFKSPTLLLEIIRNQYWDVFNTKGADKAWDLLNSTPEGQKQILLSYVRKYRSCLFYESFPEGLKNDIDFLTECSILEGIPYNTPPELAVSIYERLDIGAKIKSFGILPHTFVNDDVCNELIRSGRIKLKELPADIREKNKEYCLLQLSKGLCMLSEVPAQFITKKVILDSLNSDSIYVDFINILKSSSEYKMLENDPEFFEEVLIKTTSLALEITMEYKDSKIYPLSYVYRCCIDRYGDGSSKLALLLKRLVKTNPFFVTVVENTDVELFKELIGIGKKTLLEMLKSRPEISQHFNEKILTLFFNKVNASDDFKTHVINVVFPYFPRLGLRDVPEEIYQKQGAIVLGSEPFDAAYTYILNPDRSFRPDKPELIINYVEHYEIFLQGLDDSKYLEKCCTDPTIRQRFIHVLAKRIIANKRLFMKEWRFCVPRQLIDDTLAYLNNPALFSELDVSGTLTEPVNPLKFQQPNTSAFKLLVALHAYGFQFADKNASRQLQSEFDHAGQTHFEEVHRGQHQHSLSLFEGKGDVVGGRTLAVRNGKRVDYYKFQRLGESPATLAQEGIMHKFIARVLNKRFKSQLPRFGQYLIVLEKDLPESIRRFTDRLQVINNANGEKAYRVYHFKATKNYGKYAHTPDGTSTPYLIAERGLLNAIHDIGVLNGNVGVMPTSTIPAFHDTGRRWLFLSPLLGNSSYFALPLPGTFGGWVKAIERPDFGWDGLRDWGDVEFYGSMKSGLTARDSKVSGYSPEVLQRLSFANALCENLLAAVMLRSRLRRNSPDYHYQNQQTVKETENFIEQLLNEYLSGLLAKEKEWPPKSRLPEFMGVDQVTYRSWLTRTAEEILYWTAMQPHEVKDNCTFTLSDECYSEHIKQSGNLDTTLYPKALRRFDIHKKFPKDFHNVNDQLNLGANNAVFPLISLVKGLTLFAGNIFAFADQYTEEDNTE